MDDKISTKGFQEHDGRRVSERCIRLLNIPIHGLGITLSEFMTAQQATTLPFLAANTLARILPVKCLFEISRFGQKGMRPLVWLLFVGVK